MTFEPVGNFLNLAAKKYNLDGAVEASVMCTRFRAFLEEHYPTMAPHWNPIRYQSGKITIHPANSSASGELFMRTFELLEKIESHRHLCEIKFIDIQKWSSK